MDYHSLPRKQLQALCKKHEIPANQTNVQMADALTTLLKAEGKRKSDTNAGRMQSVGVESAKDKSVLTMNSNVSKASTRSNKEAVKSAEGGCEEHVASVEDIESNEGIKAGKTRGRGLPKLAPENKEHKDEIDVTSRKQCRVSERERNCKNSDSDFSTVDVTAKKMDQEASASEDEVVGEKTSKNIEGHQNLKAEDTFTDQENHGKHLRHPRKKTVPGKQTKPKVVDVATKRTRAGKGTHHPEVATELPVKDVDEEEKNVVNKVPVVIDIVDSDDEEVVKDKADIVDVSMNPSGYPKPVVAMNETKSPKRVVTRKGHKGGHKKDELLTTSSEEVKIDAACASVEPASNSSKCLKEAVTLTEKKEEKGVTASFDEGKVDTVDVSDEPAVKQRGQKGGKKEKLTVTNSIEEAKNVVTDVPVEAILNGSGSPKRVITRRGCKVLQSSTEDDKIDAVCDSAELASTSLKCRKQIVIRRGEKFSHKEMTTNASSEEDKIDVVDISAEPVENQRGRKGGKKEKLIVTDSAEDAKDIITDVPVEVNVNASKGVVTRKGRKGEQKKEMLKTSSDDDKFNAVGVSVEATSSSAECPKQVVTRRGQKCSHKEEKLMNASSEEDKTDVVNVSDEPAVNQRGKKGGKKEELIVTNSTEKAKDIVADVRVGATANASESPKGIVTRKGRKGEDKEVLKTGSEEDKSNAVSVSVVPTSTSLEGLKQVVTRRGQKCSQKKEKVVKATSEEDNVDVLDEPTEEAKNIVADVPVEATANGSESTRGVVTRKGRKGEDKKEVLKTGCEEDKSNAVSVSVVPTSTSLEGLTQVVTRRGQKCSQKEEKVVNASSEEDKVNVLDEPAINRRGRKGGQKKEAVTTSSEEVKNIGSDVPVEATLTVSKSPKKVITRKGCKSEHTKGEELKANSEENKVNAIRVSVDLTLNSSESLKQVATQRGIKCGQELLVTDSIKEARNDTADVSVEDNVNASESSKRLITSQGGEVVAVHEKVLDARVEESNVNPVIISVKPTVNCSEIPKHVVTRRGRVNEQEGRKGVIVISPECLKSVVSRKGGKCNQKKLQVIDSFEDVQNNASPQRVASQKESEMEHKKVVNAGAIDSMVDSVNLNEDCTKSPKYASTRRGGISRQEEVLEINIVAEADDNTTDIPVEVSLNFEDDVSVEVIGNTSLKHVTHDGQKSWFEENKVVNANPEENKVDTSDASDESIHGQAVSSSEVDQSDGKEIKDEFRNLNDKNYGSKMKTRITQQRQTPGKILQQNEGNKIEGNSSDEMQEQTSCDSDGVLQKTIIQDVEISQQKASHGDSASDREDEDFDVDNVNESLEFIEENGSYAHDQEDGDFEKKPDKVGVSSDLAARADEALEERTMAGSRVFIDNILDQSVESLEKDSILPWEAGLESAVNEKDPRSCCEEDNFTDIKEKESCLIQDLEISEQTAAHNDSSNDQDDGGLEKKQEEVDFSSDLPAKADKVMEEQTMAGNPVFINNILDQSLESKEKDSNFPCEDVLESSVLEEDPRELRYSSICEEDNFNNVEEQKICQIQDLEIPQQKATCDDSLNDLEDGDFKKKPEKISSGLDLAAQGENALEERTVAGDGMIVGSTVCVNNFLDKFVEPLEKDSKLPNEVDIGSVVNHEDGHEFKDSTSCEEEDLNDVKEISIQDSEISRQKVSHGDSISDQEDGDFNVDSLNEVLESVEENTNQHHGDSDNDQEDVDSEKRSDKVCTCSYLAAKTDKALEEQTMSVSIVSIDNMLDQYPGSVEKNSNFLCEASLDSAVNEEDVHYSRDSSSSCEEDNFNDADEREIYLIQDLEISQLKAAGYDSFNDQADRDFVMKPVKAYTSLDLAEKDDDALEEHKMAGDVMITGSRILLNINSAVNEEDAHGLRDSSSCEEVTLNDAKEKEVAEISEQKASRGDSANNEEEILNDVKEKELPQISEQKASHGDSADNEEVGDFEKKLEKAYNSASLTAQDDDTAEDQTMVGDAMIADKSVEFLEKDSNLPCEVSIVSIVNEENAHELRDSRSSEEGNFNCLQEKELHPIQNLEISQQKISYDDSSSVQENGDFEKKSEEVYSSPDLAAKDDEALENQIMASTIAGSTDFVDDMIAKSVESQDEISNLHCEVSVDVPVNEENAHESKDSSSEEDNSNDVKEKEINRVGGLDLAQDEDEDSGGCHSGEVSVVNDGPQNLLSYVVQEATLSGTPLKKLEHAGSTIISHFSGTSHSAVEERQEPLATDCCKDTLSQSDASLKIYGLIEGHKKLNTPTKKREFTSSTNVSPWSGIDHILTEDKVERPQLDTLQEMQFIKDQLCPHLNSLFGEDAPLKKSELTGSFGIAPCSGMKDCMKDDCNLGVPELDSTSKTFVLEKGQKESLFSDALFGEGSQLKRCELINFYAVPHSGMDGSSIKQIKVSPSTEAGKIEPSEFDASSKVFAFTDDNGLSISPCLNIFDTSLKNPVLQSSTGMPISSDMDDSTADWSQKDYMIEDCNLGVPEVDSTLKTLVLEKGQKESLFSDALFGEGSQLKRCELINFHAVPPSGMDGSSTEAGNIELSEFDAPSKVFDCTDDNDFSFSPCLNIFDTPLKNPALQSSTGMPISSGMKEDYNLEVPQIDSLSNMLLREKGHDRCLFFDTLFVEGIPLKKCDLINTNTVPHSSMDDSAIEQSEADPAIEQSEADPLAGTCKKESFEFDAPSKMSDCTKDDDFSFSPCLNTLDAPLKDPVLQSITSSSEMSACLGVVDSVIHKVQEVLPMEASKNELSQIEDSSVAKSGNIFSTDTCKLERNSLELKSPSMTSEFTKNDDESPFTNTLCAEKIVSTSKYFEHTSTDNSPCGIDDSDAKQTRGVLPELGISELSTPSDISELSTDDDAVPCLEDLSVVTTDTSLKNRLFTRGIDGSSRDKSWNVLSKKTQNTEDQVRSPCLETLFVDDRSLLSGMDNSPADQTMDVLPTEAYKQELSQLDALSKISEDSKDHNRSPCLNAVFLEGNGGTDSGLDKMLEINRPEDSRLQMALDRQSSSTKTERPKLANIDDSLQCVEIDNYAPIEDFEIPPIEASNLRCCQSDSHLKMVEPTEGHDNPGFQSRLAIKSDLMNLSLGQLRRLYKEKQMKRKKRGKVIRKHPALQDLSSIVFGEASSSFRKLEECQQDCKTNLQCINVSEVKTTLNETELAEASDKLDKLEECHQKSPAEIRLPQITSSCRTLSGDYDCLSVSPAAGAIILENMFGESQQECKTSLNCNNDLSQVNITAKELELAEASEKLHKPEEYSTETNYVLRLTSPTEVRLPEMTSGYRASGDLDCFCVSPSAGAIISENVFGESQQDCKMSLNCNYDVSQVNIISKELGLAEEAEKLEEFSTETNYFLPQTSPAEVRSPEMTSSFRATGSSIDNSILEDNQKVCNQPFEVYSPLSKPELAEACNKPYKLDENSKSLNQFEDTGDHDILFESTAPRIMIPETVFVDENNVLEEPIVPSKSFESGLFVEEHKVESRIPNLVDRLKVLNDRLQSMQSNLQGLAPEPSYATPLRKGINCRSIGSAKKNRVPMSVGRSGLAFAKENSMDKTPLSLKKDQRSCKENQIKSKDSEKVVGKRPALKHLSLNELGEREKTGTPH